MTIHSSLKTKSGSLSQHRNVLKRAERISKLALQEKFDMKKSNPLGMAKVGNINIAAGKKKKVEGDAATPGAAAPAAGAKGAAPAAKGAPAAGAKGSAPTGPLAAKAGAAGGKPAAGGKAAPAAKKK
ncbi:MAG: hypothetical protein SGJ11_10035 [Phycisphaerae bacterium]|nr:hypothetical protein [Phycisphaerae bacterium]